MSIERDKDFEQLEDIAAMMTENSGIEFENGKYVYYGLDGRTAFAAVYISGAWSAWQAAKAQAVPEGFVLVPREMHWHKADDLACLEWGRHVGLFCSENRDMSALQVEEYRLRWCKNKAHQIMRDYKAMIEAQESK